MNLKEKVKKKLIDSIEFGIITELDGIRRKENC